MSWPYLIIVYDNVAIFGRWVHLGMVNNVVNGSFELLGTKNPFFNFACDRFFCEASTKNMAQNATTPLFTQSGPCFMDNSKVL